MKKTIYLLFALLLGLTSCVEELSPDKRLSKTTEGTNAGQVAVTMQLQIPQLELMADTKSKDRAHLPNIESIHVAGFGVSGYPQAYSKAEPVNKTTDAEGHIVYVPGPYASTNAPDTYYFRVLLPIYEGEAHVHIIANGPESITFVNQDENSIMAQMATTYNETTGEYEGAYWTRVVLEDGILAEKDKDGIMETDDNGNFKPSAATAAKFEDLVLVRNFAEITLNIASTAGISDVTWALVNTPVSGSVAPMKGTAYVDSYEDYVYDVKTAKMVLAELDENGKPIRDEDGNIQTLYDTYNGYMVSNALNMLPDAENKLNWISATNPHFCYERVDPNKTNPTYILMRAKFTDNKYYYYRVDLLDENVGGYFPLYRNYKYDISINYVGNKGDDTYDKAAEHNSGGNVSMSAETKTLTDVSDGFSRMYVEFVEKTYTTGGQKSFWVYYIPDVSTGDIDNRSIKVSVKDMGTALASATITKDPDRSVDTGEGAMYFYNFSLNGQSEDADLESVIQVKADNGGTSTLYRDITVKVMKKMDMDLSLNPNPIEPGKDINTVLHIKLSDTLQQSMFPLEFYIEDTNRTLNPTGKNGKGETVAVPVKLGKSLDGTNPDSYYYVRTVNWSEYEPMRDAWLAASADNRDDIIDFTTEFRTIKEASATKVYVDNEYFNLDDVDLSNNSNNVFRFSSNFVQVAADATEASFNIISHPTSTTWTLYPSADVEIISITKAAGSSVSDKGDAEITVRFPSNSGSIEPKEYTIRAEREGSDDPITITIIQSAIKFTLSSDDGGRSNGEDGWSISAKASETTKTFKIISSSSQPWSIGQLPNGVSIPNSEKSGSSGETTIHVTFPSNMDNADPVSYEIPVILGDNVATRKFTINQAEPKDVSVTTYTNSSTYPSGKTSYEQKGVTVSFSAIYGRDNSYVTIAKSGQNVKVSATGKIIKNITINWSTNYANTTTDPNSNGVISNGESQTTWTASPNTNVSEVQLNLSRTSGNNNSRIRISSIKIDCVE